LKKADGSNIGDLDKVLKWLKDSTGGHLTSVNQFLRCVLCWRGRVAGEKGKHAAGDCGWLASFNRYRSNASLAPIVIVESAVRVGAEKQQVTVESLMKELRKERAEFRGKLSELDQRMSALELKVGQQPESSSSSTKAAAPPEGSLTKKQKKAARQAERAGQSSGTGGTRAKGKERAGK